ncbi:MAG: hypothetical protein GXP45_07780 [bacterium]|nr:hypothetical protein [bacterium]
MENKKNYSYEDFVKIIGRAEHYQGLLADKFEISISIDNNYEKNLIQKKNDAPLASISAKTKGEKAGKTDILLIKTDACEIVSSKASPEEQKSDKSWEDIINLFFEDIITKSSHPKT